VAASRAMRRSLRVPRLDLRQDCALRAQDWLQSAGRAKRAQEIQRLNIAVPSQIDHTCASRSSWGIPLVLEVSGADRNIRKCSDAIVTPACRSTISATA
jgi:hypothetical protein